MDALSVSAGSVCSSHPCGAVVPVVLVLYRQG